MGLTGIDSSPARPFRTGLGQCEIVHGRRHGPAVLPSVIFVGDELAGGVDAGAHLGDVRRAKIVPAVLVPSHELHAHGPPHRLRQDGGSLPGVLVAAAAERARAFVILHAHFLDRQAENLGQHIARVVHVLGRRHHQRAIGADIGDGAIRPERQMTLIGRTIGGHADVGRLGKTVVGIAPIGDHRVGRLCGTHCRIDIVGRQRRRRLPGHFERRCGLDRVPLAFGDNTDKIALADDARARNVGDRALVDAQRLRKRAERALPARQDGAPVEHPRHAHVLHVRVLRAHLGRDIDAWDIGADEPVLARMLLRRRPGEPDLERLLAEELAIGHRTARRIVDRHHPARHREAPGLNAKPHGGAREQRLARLSRCRPHLRAAAMDRRTRRGRALLRRDVGVEPDRAQLAHVEVKFFAGDLHEPGGAALPQLAFAEEERGRVIRMDRDPGVDGIRIGGTGDLARRGGNRTRKRHAGEAEPHDEGAALDEVAPRDGRIGESGDHCAPPVIRVEASWIAFMIRG